MMPSGGSQGQGMQGVFGLPRNDTFPQFGQRATTPSQGNTRFGFGPQSDGPRMSSPFGAAPMQQAPQMSNPYSFNMQTPQNTQGLNQGQINSGVYVNPQGNVSFSGGPASPMSSLTAGFLGRGQPQPSFHQNGSGPPAPSYTGGPNPGFGPSPPSFGGQDPMFGQTKPMIQAPQTGGASPFPASQAPQFDMFGRPTVANRNPFAR